MRLPFLLCLLILVSFLFHSPSAYLYTHNPIQLLTVCCGGHYVDFPMYFFSLAKAFGINETHLENPEFRLPEVLMVMMVQKNFEENQPLLVLKQVEEAKEMKKKTFMKVKHLLHF